MSIDKKTNVAKWVAIAITVLTGILALFGIEIPESTQKVIQKWSVPIITGIIAIVAHFTGKNED